MRKLGSIHPRPRLTILCILDPPSRTDCPPSATWEVSIPSAPSRDPGSAPQALQRSSHNDPRSFSHQIKRRSARTTEYNMAGVGTRSRERLRRRAFPCCGSTWRTPRLMLPFATTAPSRQALASRNLFWDLLVVTPARVPFASGSAKHWRTSCGGRSRSAAAAGALQAPSSLFHHS